MGFIKEGPGSNVNCLINRLLEGEDSSELKSEAEVILQMKGNEGSASLELIHPNLCPAYKKPYPQ